MSNNWKEHQLTQTIEVHREGWIGLWDHFKSLITGTERLSVSKPITISFWSKGDVEMSMIQGECGGNNEEQV